MARPEPHGAHSPAVVHLGHIAREQRALTRHNSCCLGPAWLAPGHRCSVTILCSFSVGWPSGIRCCAKLAQTGDKCDQDAKQVRVTGVGNTSLGTLVPYNGSNAGVVHEGDGGKQVMLDLGGGGKSQQRGKGV